jgi:hypothetical protein
METLAADEIKPPCFSVVAVKGQFCAQPQLTTTRGTNSKDAATIIMVHDVVSLSGLSLM